MENKNEVQQRFIELRAKGNSYDRIASKLEVSKGTLIEWSKQLSVDINNLRSVETDTLLEKYKMAKSHQMEMYGTQLNKVRNEFEKRELSDISTDKLLVMELKLLDAINNTSGGVRFSSTELFLDLPATEWEA